MTTTQNTKRSRQTPFFKSSGQLLVALCVFLGVMLSSLACGTRVGREVDTHSRFVLNIGPVRSLVLIDDVPRGQSRPGEPFSVIVDPGFRRIEIEARGYRVFRSDADPEPGEVYELDVELWPRVPELE